MLTYKWCKIFHLKECQWALDSRGEPGTFLNYAGPSHAFQVVHPLNATNDPPIYLVITQMVPEFFPNVPGQSCSHRERQWASVDSSRESGFCFVCDGKPVDSDDWNEMGPRSLCLSARTVP